MNRQHRIFASKCRWIILILVFVISNGLFAQKTGSLDSLLTRVQTLEKQLQSMETQREKAAKKARLKAFLNEAKSGSQKEEPSETRKFHSGLRQQSALNPNISLGGDFYAAWGSSDSDYNRVPSETSPGTGQIFLRELELGIESALDPFSRAKVFLAFGREGVELEEGYVEWLNCPLNMNLKLGEFKTQFGQLNRYHEHALPQFDRPFALVNYFGSGGIKGFGIAGNFLLPSITAHVNELDLQVISGDDSPSFTGSGKHNFVYVSHLKNYYDLNSATYFELGFSGAYGKHNAAETKGSLVGGVDITLKWSPPSQQKYKGLEWRTEALVSRRETPAGDIDTWGAFTSLQYKLNARTLISSRLDYSQLPWDEDAEEKGVTLALDYWQSEFVFIRFQYTIIDRNFEENDNRFIVQTAWAMGPHRHEAY